jgi:Tol biopolymer transport system component
LIYAFSISIIILITSFIIISPKLFHKKTFTPIKTQLTSSPYSEKQPCFSPDGKKIVYRQGTDGETGHNLFIQMVDIKGSEPIQLTYSPQIDYYPAWSPDGQQIAFVRKNNKQVGIWSIPAYGGQEQQIIATKIISSISWTPDGKNLAFSDFDSLRKCRIFLYSFETGKRKQITFPDNFKYKFDIRPRVSPDGKYIAFLRGSTITSSHIYIVPLEGGSPEKITKQPFSMRSLCWTHDSKAIIISAYYSSSLSLLKIPVNSGEPQAIIGGGQRSKDPAISPDGKFLVYSEGVIVYPTYRVKIPKDKNETVAPEIFIRSSRADNGAVYSTDGSQIAFNSSRSGYNQIWACDSSGQNAYQVTNMQAEASLSPSWSPDGNWLAFINPKDGNHDIFIISKKGTNLRQFTNDPSPETDPFWSRNGRWIYYSCNKTGRFQIWKCKIDGSEAQQFSTVGGMKPIESFDGKWLYFSRPGIGIWRKSTTGDKEEKVLDRKIDIYLWSLGKNGIYFMDKDSGRKVPTTICYYDFFTKQITKFINIGNQGNIHLSVTPDEKYIIYSQNDYSNSDLIIVENWR